MPHTLVLVAVLGIGLFLRWRNLDVVQHFQGDQGHTYMVVWRWLHDGQWPLIGPTRSVGGFHLGPGYWYTVAPALR